MISRMGKRVADGVGPQAGRLAAFRAAWLIAAAAVLGLPACAASTDNLLIATFDGRGNAFSARIRRHPAISVVTGEGVDGSDAIRVAYEGYPLGSRRVIVTRALPSRWMEATLTYDVKFCDEFRFVKGGKLHGLGPENLAAGGLSVAPDAWSARVVFREDGGIGTYVYHQDLRGQYGEETTSGTFRFSRGRYYSVSLQVRLNDPPEAANGYARVFVDGAEVARHENVRFRATDGTRTLISSALFNTFHGGSTEDYAPRDDDGSFSTECAYFDNLAVYPRLVIKERPGV